MQLGKIWDNFLARGVIILPKICIAAYVGKAFIVLSALKSPNAPLLTTDFIVFWVASSLALTGKATSVYDLPNFCKALAQAAGHDCSAAWFFPPTFLLIIAPASLLNYYSALACWLSLSLVGYILVIWRIAPHPTTLWLALAFPGVLTNISYGQTGLFFCSITGGGLLLLTSSPVAAGILLGLLSFKPNYFVLVPIALIAGRHWRALGSTMITAVILAISSVLVFGWETWAAYWAFRHAPMQAIQHGILPLNTMPTIFAATLMLGGGLPVSYLLQGITMVVSTIAVIWIWSRRPPISIRISVLILGSLLFTPYGHEYDLVRLAIPIAWIGWEGYQKGWLPGEKTFLILGWLTPLISRVLAAENMAYITPLFLVALLYFNLTSPRLSSIPCDLPRQN